jgi:hypothetical protein
MKTPRMVADLLAVADVCIEASEARARLLESRKKGSPRKKQQDDQEVNTIDHGDCENRGNHQQQPIEQKEKRLFHCLADAKKWCEIHHTTGHDLKECKPFLDCKKIPAPQATQEPHHGEHCRTDLDNEDQMGRINVIFGGSLSISSKTQGKKLEREINLTQCIKLDRRMNLSFMVKLSIGRHMVAKTLVDRGASLNLIMRKTFIEMGLNLVDLTQVHDISHGVIPG